MVGKTQHLYNYLKIKSVEKYQLDFLYSCYIHKKTLISFLVEKIQHKNFPFLLVITFLPASLNKVYYIYGWRNVLIHRCLRIATAEQSQLLVEQTQLTGRTFTTYWTEISNSQSEIPNIWSEKHKSVGETQVPVGSLQDVFGRINPTSGRINPTLRLFIIISFSNIWNFQNYCLPLPSLQT